MAPAMIPLSTAMRSVLRLVARFAALPSTSSVELSAVEARSRFACTVLRRTRNEIHAKYSVLRRGIFSPMLWPVGL